MNIKNLFGAACAAMAVMTAGAKTEMSLPVLEDLTYTGEAQAAVVPPSTKYTVLSNEGGTDCGDYLVVLLLNDPDNFRWPDTDEAFAAVGYKIAKAANAWTEAPFITGWTYGEEQSAWTAVAKFGVPHVTFDGETFEGATVSGAAVVDAAGDYRAVFSVEGTDNYEGLRTEVPFTVKRASISGGGGTGDASLSSAGYEGVYDGEGHSIAVIATGDDFTVTYALAECGPYVASNPVFTNACDVTV